IPHRARDRQRPSLLLRSPRSNDTGRVSRRSWPTALLAALPEKSSERGNQKKCTVFPPSYEPPARLSSPPWPRPAPAPVCIHSLSQNDVAMRRPDPVNRRQSFEPSLTTFFVKINCKSWSVWI